MEIIIIFIISCYRTTYVGALYLKFYLLFMKTVEFFLTSLKHFLQFYNVNSLKVHIFVPNSSVLNNVYKLPPTLSNKITRICVLNVPNCVVSSDDASTDDEDRCETLADFSTDFVLESVAKLINAIEASSLAEQVTETKTFTQFPP